MTYFFVVHRQSNVSVFERWFYFGKTMEGQVKFMCTSVWRTITMVEIMLGDVSVDRGAYWWIARRS